jgi:hypothetical protein
MVDTFKPLMVTEEAMKIADDDYFKSWLDSPITPEWELKQKIKK